MATLLDLLQISQESISLVIVALYVIGILLIRLIKLIKEDLPPVPRTLASFLMAILAIVILVVVRPYLPFRVSDLIYYLIGLMVFLVVIVVLLPAGGVGKALWELILYLLSPFIWLVSKYWAFWRDHRIIAPVILFLLFSVAFAVTYFVRTRPEPFRVNIELKEAGSTGDGSGGDNLRSVLYDLETKMERVYDVAITVEPVEDAADLTITLTLNNDDCRDDHYISDNWRWEAGGELEQILMMLQLDKLGAHTEDNKNLCNWTRTSQDLEVLILLAYGLEIYYINPLSPDVDAGDVFETAYFRLLYIDDTKKVKTPPQTDMNELALQRRMLTCARVMAVIADGTNLNINEKRDLKETIAKDPYEGSAPPVDYCVAQAYYGLGRGEMEHHLQLLQQNPDKAAQALEEAIHYFNQALDTYEATTSSQPGNGFQWSYYFYRGLARYRQGQFQRARQDLKLAEEMHDDTLINSISLETISYLRARFELEESLYDSLWGSTCSEPQLTDSDGQDEPTPLTRLQQLQDSDRTGLTPLSIGAMSLLSEARYWEVLASCDPNAQARADHSKRAIENAEAARTKIDSGTKDEEVAAEPSTVDVFLDHLYAKNGQNGNSTSSVDRHMAAYNKGSGIPAYVISLPGDSPWPLRWLVRNSYDEPLFDFAHLLPANGEPAVGNICASMFCAQLDDGDDNTIEWPLIDRGYGLFVAQPPSDALPFAHFIAEPGEEGTILLRSDLYTSLIYHKAETDPIEIFVGTLPITTTAVLSAEVNVEWDGNAVDCHSCYQLDIDLQLTAEEYAITELSTNGDDGLPTLFFKASLFEGTLPLDESLSSDNHWQPIGGSFIKFPIQDGNGRFKGSFGSVLLDTSKHHAVRIFVEDQQGNKIYEDWILEIKIPA